MAAGIAVPFVIPAIQVICDRLAAPIIRNFKYLCCFNTNITNLRHEAERLDEAREGLQARVDAATNNAQVVLPQIMKWFNDVDSIKDTTSQIIDEVPGLQTGCFKVRARFRTSRRATKTANTMKELQEQLSKYHTISHPPPIPAVSPIPLPSTVYEFESRREIEEQTFTYLQNGNAVMIGLSGMGGIGKTTLAQKIMNRALNGKLVDEVAMAVVSRPMDKLNIQLQLSEQLGLKLEEETLVARARKLRERMSSKRMLIVLDDLWNDLVLEEIGIPLEGNCSILLISRNRDVLRRMNVDAIIELGVLSDEEAEFLFREKVGAYPDDIMLTSTAQQLVKECNGLPIALSVLGAALKDQTGPIWHNALRELRNSNPINVPEVIAKVYQPLRLSYDLLDSNDAKALFVLCSLFAEDVVIEVDDLIFFSRGLSLFEEKMNNLEEERQRMHALIKILRNRFLVLEGDLKVHDVIRDISIFIAKEKGYVGGEDSKWVTSAQLGQERIRQDLRLGFPNLKLMLLNGNIGDTSGRQLEIGESIFEDLTMLRVLSIGHYTFRSPHSISPLKNLKTLILSDCDWTGTLSSIGDLVNLEVLICEFCLSLTELPVEMGRLMGRLSGLKLLKILCCASLRRIGPGILSNLVGLEELEILHCFKNWEADDTEENLNVPLRELEKLINLTCLKIQISDPALAAQDMHISSKLLRFDITIGNNSDEGEPPLLCSKKICINWAGTPLANWVEHLLANTEDLWFSANSVRNSNFQEIWHRVILSNSNIKGLHLQNMQGIEQLWSSSNLPFDNLWSISVRSCPSLRNLGQLSNESLRQLKNLIINDCEMIEEVFLWNNQSGSAHSHTTKVFPMLDYISLDTLPNLTAFCHGIQELETPLLTYIRTHNCPKLRLRPF